MTSTRPHERAPAARLPALAALATLAAGCATTLPSPSGPAGGPIADAGKAEPTEGTGEFTVAASSIDTWNAVGQILVRLDGVDYRSRSQMLGVYAVQYLGEEFLIHTQALVIDSPDDSIATRVGAVLPDGQPGRGAAAAELLRLLQQRLPAELARLAADEEYQKLVTPPEPR